VPFLLETYMAELQRFGIRPGLDRIRALLASAGNPQNQYPIVLIGGTNGKGSTCEFLARRLTFHGRIGLYTSPHLYRWNERIRVLDATQSGPFCGLISDDDFDALLTDALPHIEGVTPEHGQPTEFEILTFLGLWHFARCGVQAAVVEVGLGGLWDATNVTEPLVSVVTHVALDHCDRLGNTREEIAADKAGIARPDRAFVTAETLPNVLQVLEERCTEIGARLVRVPDEDESTVEIDRTSVLPVWQRINARTAAVAARELESELGWPSSPEATAVAVPGRAEIVRQNPTVILDGANNPDGAQHLADHLRAVYPDRKFIFVAGFSADKDWRAMLEIWQPLAAHWIATQATHPRAATSEELARALGETSAAPVEAIAHVGDAVQRALQTAAPDDIIVIAGSFFVLAEVDRAAL
jgi:dihydrofolate synthase/folylpolyglutamate synthase